MTVKRFRALLWLCLGVSILDAAYSALHGLTPAQAHVPLQVQMKALTAAGWMPGPWTIGLAAALSFFIIVLGVMAWVNLFRLQIRGRVYLAAALALSFFVFPAFSARHGQAALSALAGLGLLPVPGPVEVMLGHLSSLLNGVLLTIVFSDLGKDLFQGKV
jgi:hypothetical protein